MIQLTPDQASAASLLSGPQGVPPSDPSLQGGLDALSGGVAPSAPVALPPSITAAQPPAPTGGTTASGIPKNSQKFSDKLAAASAATPVPQGPVGWAKHLINATLVSKSAGAVSDVLAGLGDSANVARDYRPGQSPLAAVAQTLQARGARIGAQKQQALDNQLKMGREQREQQKADDLHMQSIRDTIHAQKAAYRLDEDNVERHVKSGRIAAEPYRENHDLLGDNISQTDLFAGAKKGGIYDPSKSVVFQTGVDYQNEGDHEIAIPTYTIFNRSAKPVTVDDDASRLLSRYGQPVPAGSKMDGDTYNYVTSQAIAAQTTDNLIHQADVEWRTQQHSVQHNKDLSDVSGAIGFSAADPITSLGNLSKQIDPKTKQPTPIAQASTRLLNDMDPVTIEKHRENLAKEQEKVKKDAQDAAAKAAATKEKADAAAQATAAKGSSAKAKTGTASDQIAAQAQGTTAPTTTDQIAAQAQGTTAPTAAKQAPSLTDIHKNPKTGQTIGWNGSSWIDTKSGQPVN